MPPSAYPGALDAFPTDRVNATPTAGTHPADHNDVNDAVNKIEAQLRTNAGEVGAFAAVLQADTTDPNLGTGGSSEGYYATIAELVFVWVRFEFGTSSNPGNGAYFMELPVEAAQVQPVLGFGQNIGHGLAGDLDNTANRRTVVAELLAQGPPSTVRWRYSAAGNVSNAAPFTWAAGDVLTSQMFYPRA